MLRDKLNKGLINHKSCTEFQKENLKDGHKFRPKSCKDKEKFYFA